MSHRDSKYLMTLIFQKPIHVIDGKEAGEQHYIMVGDQIKYEPAWAANPDHKKNMQALDTKNCTKPLAGLRRSKLLASSTKIQGAKSAKQRPKTPNAKRQSQNSQALKDGVNIEVLSSL